jgi:hypothetical protein
MSRSIADFLVQENNYEDEYKRNFSDYFTSDSESTHSIFDDPVREYQEKQHRLERARKFYNEFILVSRSYGFLNNATLYDFCKLIGQEDVFDQTL